MSFALPVFVERSRSAAAVVLRIYGLVISPAMCATA
jgi:hypothetical protein